MTKRTIVATPPATPPAIAAVLEDELAMLHSGDQEMRDQIAAAEERAEIAQAEREEARRIANSLRPASYRPFPWETWGKPYPYGDPPCESCATVEHNRTLYPPSTTTPAAWLCWECAR